MMKIKAYAYWSALAVILVGAMVLLVLEDRPKPVQQQGSTQQKVANPDLQPLVTTKPNDTRSLPANTIVLNMADAQSVKTPFALREDISSPGRKVLYLPEGAGTSKAAGMALFAFDTPAKTTYHVWVRARWDNSCGNSISLGIDDETKHAVGQDSVFNLWHWVKAGDRVLTSGKHLLTIGEREDGVAVDQVIVTGDAMFIPTGPVSTTTASVGVRRFADDFARSPGHGMEAWNLRSGKWGIEFSLDPNRIPNQYSLAGKNTSGKPAIALVRGQPWRGSIISFNALVPMAGKIGAVVDLPEADDKGLYILIQTREGEPTLQVTGPGVKATRLVGEQVRSGQWHNFRIERWASVLRVFVDDHPVFSQYDLLPKLGAVGLCVCEGSGVFDDVKVEGAPWQADGPNGMRIPWTVAAGAKWFRPIATQPKAVLVGRAGRISTQYADLPIAEIVFNGGSPANCVIDDGFVRADENQDLQIFRPTLPAPTSFGISAKTGEVKIKSIAIRYGTPVRDTFRLGPYHFTKLQIEDPSDYLDFTPAEWEQTKKSGNKNLLRRGRKVRMVVGKSKGEVMSAWVPRSGRWMVRKAALLGMGPKGSLKLWRDVNSDLEATLRVNRTSPGAIADLVLYAGVGEPGARVRVGDRSDLPRENAIVFADAKPGTWHDLRMRVSNGTLSAKIDKGDWKKIPFRQGCGGGIFLEIHSGSVWFDDVEFNVLRRSDHGFLYAFDRRETDWWRVGGKWQNHGGISCALASNWISLIATRGMGVLWNKRAVTPDVLVAFNVEESSDWFGWNKNPTHIHYPYDNIQVFLASEEDTDEGYRLEINSRRRTATVLYRNGREVAKVDQRTKSFPIRYVGKHQPYEPRRNRIVLAKQGGLLRIIINDQEVLRYEDPEPLPISKVGVGGYRTRFNLSNIEICELPQKP